MEYSRRLRSVAIHGQTGLRPMLGDVGDAPGRGDRKQTMNVTTFIVCDYARVADGKLDVLGGGWNLTGPDPVPSAIALTVEVPWAETDETHKLVLALLRDDGSLAESDDGQPLFRAEADLVIQRRPGVILGDAEYHHLAIGVPPLPFRAGARYRWSVTIDGVSKPEWERWITVRPARFRQAG
jgi:hypothetical protein